MEGFLFSTPMIISPVDVEHRITDVDEMIESSVARELFVSEDPQIFEPYEGMEFESEEAAKAFYNLYAAQIGFKARVSSFIRSKRDKSVISRQLVCSREGFRSTKDSNDENRSKRARTVTRVGCRAMIMVKRQISGKWFVSKCEKLHNHVLGTQGKVVMLDYDPYVCDGDDMLETSTGRERNFYGEMVVEPPEGDPNFDPHEGMEFESEQVAQIFYKEYARRVGFRARVSSYYRSKRDNSIISRLIVCSKEGFRAKKDEISEEQLQRPRAVTRVGCKAMIMVKKRDSGKWVVSKLVKGHNHVLNPRTTSEDERSEAEDDEMDEMEKKIIVVNDECEISEPYEGMEFESEEAAKLLYFGYSRRMGFNMRVSTYYRSKRNKSIISRLFVCSKEGFYLKKDASSEDKIKRPREATRVGCKAMLMVKKNNSGKWLVSKFEKEHNHPLGSLRKIRKIRKRKDLPSNTKMLKNHSGRESPSSRYNNLCREAIKYAEAGASSADVYSVAMRALRDAVKKVTAIKNNSGGFQNNIDSVSGSNLDDSGNQDIHDEGDTTLGQQSRASGQLSSPLSNLRHERPQRLRVRNIYRHHNDITSQSSSTKQIFGQTNIVSIEQSNIGSDEPINELTMQGNC